METIKIMLVDDEERFLTTTKKLLNKKGYDVLTAMNGKEALERLGCGPLDVIILDVKMPDMDGLETLGRLKKTNPGIEVILLTGHASVDAAVEGMRLGAFDYLMKPCDVEDLIEKIDQAYEHKTIREKRTGRTQ